MMKPCKRGHVSGRYRCGHCILCSKEAARRGRLKNPERALGNPETAREAKRRWRRENIDRAREMSRRWKREHLQRVSAYVAGRHTRQINATPAWSDQKAIKRFYENRPKGHHVDHIIPLKGKTVCGLHVLENLQYLPATENCKKHNSLQTVD